MAANNLIFTKNARNRYESKFVSTGNNVVVQMDIGTGGEFVVYANLPGMNPATLLSSGRQNTGNVIFEVNVPDGVEITIESMGEVISAKISG